MPAYAPRLVLPAGFPSTIGRFFDQPERRLLRIGNDCYAANIGVGRWYKDRASKTSDLRGGGVQVVDGDVSHPSRRRPQSPPLVRDIHEPAQRGAAATKHRV